MANIYLAFSQRWALVHTTLQILPHLLLPESERKVCPFLRNWFKLILLINAHSWGRNQGLSQSEPSVFPTSTQVTSRSHCRSTNEIVLFLKHPSLYDFSILLHHIAHSTSKSNCSRYLPVENTLSLSVSNKDITFFLPAPMLIPQYLLPRPHNWAFSYKPYKIFLLKCKFYVPQGDHYLLEVRNHVLQHQGLEK